jgi:transposase
MPEQITTACRYPLFEALLMQKALPLKGIYTNRDVAAIFDVSVRTIQDWITDNKMRARKLPGRGRFLSGDLEAFLQASGTKSPGEE